MSADVPAWLGPSLAQPNAGLPKHAAQLLIAQLADQRSFARGGFALSSPAFGNGEELDPCFTADEEDAVAPPLEWTAPPPGAQEVVIVVEDADANGDAPTLHWAVFGLPGQKGKLLEGETPPRVCKNGKGKAGWLLPEPPQDDAAHRYIFQIFALDLPMTLMPGRPVADLIASMKGHVTAANVLIGTYKRDDGSDDGGGDEDFE